MATQANTRDPRLQSRNVLDLCLGAFLKSVEALIAFLVTSGGPIDQTHRFAYLQVSVPM